MVHRVGDVQIAVPRHRNRVRPVERRLRRLLEIAIEAGGAGAGHGHDHAGRAIDAADAIVLGVGHVDVAVRRDGHRRGRLEAPDRGRSTATHRGRRAAVRDRVARRATRGRGGRMSPRRASAKYTSPLVATATSPAVSNIGSAPPSRDHGLWQASRSTLRVTLHERACVEAVALATSNRHDGRLHALRQQRVVRPQLPRRARVHDSAASRAMPDAMAARAIALSHHRDGIGGLPTRHGRILRPRIPTHATLTDGHRSAHRRPASR